MDTKYSFTTIHVLGALYKERGLINSGGKYVKYGREILELPEVVWSPKQVAVMHCQEHQKGEMTVVWGNQKADREAKQAALIGGQTLASLTTALCLCPLSEWDPRYTSQEQAWFETEEEIFYRMDGESLLMAALPYLGHWLPQLSSSSMKELTQGRQLSRPPWPSIFMSPSSPA
jgi:hypothetical protein